MLALATPEKSVTAKMTQNWFRSQAMAQNAIIQKQVADSIFYVIF